MKWRTKNLYIYSLYDQIFFIPQKTSGGVERITSYVRALLCVVCMYVDIIIIIIIVIFFKKYKNKNKERKKKNQDKDASYFSRETH